MQHKYGIPVDGVGQTYAQITNMNTETLSKFKPLKRIEVNSSHVKSLGHDAEALVMQVEFYGRPAVGPTSVYNYYPITSDTYKKILTADSVGGMINTLIKKDTNIKYAKLEA